MDGKYELKTEEISKINDGMFLIARGIQTSKNSIKMFKANRDCDIYHWQLESLKYKVMYYKKCLEEHEGKLKVANKKLDALKDKKQTPEKEIKPTENGVAQILTDTKSDKKTNSSDILDLKIKIQTEIKKLRTQLDA